MELNARKITVIMANPLTGEEIKLNGRPGISVHLGEFKPKMNLETQRYSWEAKLSVRFSKRMRKAFQGLTATIRVPKYICKSKLVAFIYQHDPEHWTGEQLMRLTHKQLLRLATPFLLSDYLRKNTGEVYHPKRQFPCGGIIPCSRDYEDNINRADLVIQKERLAQLQEHLFPNMEQIEGKAIGVEEIRKALHLPG